MILKYQTNSEITKLYNKNNNLEQMSLFEPVVNKIYVAVSNNNERYQILCLNNLDTCYVKCASGIFNNMHGYLDQSGLFTYVTFDDSDPKIKKQQTIQFTQIKEDVSNSAVKLYPNTTYKIVTEGKAENTFVTTAQTNNGFKITFRKPIEKQTDFVLTNSGEIYHIDTSNILSRLLIGPDHRIIEAFVRLNGLREYIGTIQFHDNKCLKFVFKVKNATFLPTLIIDVITKQHYYVDEEYNVYNTIQHDYPTTCHDSYERIGKCGKLTHVDAVPFNDYGRVYKFIADNIEYEFILIDMHNEKYHIEFINCREEFLNAPQMALGYDGVYKPTNKHVYMIQGLDVYDTTVNESIYAPKYETDKNKRSCFLYFKTDKKIFTISHYV